MEDETESLNFNKIKLIFITGIITSIITLVFSYILLRISPPTMVVIKNYEEIITSVTKLKQEDPIKFNNLLLEIGVNLENIENKTKDINKIIENIYNFVENNNYAEAKDIVNNDLSKYEENEISEYLLKYIEKQDINNSIINAYNLFFNEKYEEAEKIIKEALLNHSNNTEELEKNLVNISKRPIEINYTNLYIDGDFINLDDKYSSLSNPIVYNTNIYLPLSTVIKISDRNINWSNDENTVYIDKTVGKSTYLGYDILPYRTIGKYTVYKDNEYVSMSGDKYYKAYRFQDHTRALYNIQGKYSNLSGIVGIPDDSNASHWGFPRSITVYGDNNILETFKFEQFGDIPKEFSIDITGVNQLELGFRSYSSNNDLAFADVIIH